jgi:hypothetical protein
MDKSVRDERIGPQTGLQRGSGGLFRAANAAIELQSARFMGLATAVMLDASYSDHP